MTVREGWSGGGGAWAREEPCGWRVGEADVEEGGVNAAPALWTMVPSEPDRCLLLRAAIEDEPVPQ